MEKIKNQKDTATQSLKKMIEDWLAENPKRKIATLINKSGVSKSSVRRVVNEDTLPSPINLYKILLILLNPEKKFLEISGIPDVFKVYFENTQLLNTFKEAKKFILLGDIENYLQDSTSLLIFSRASLGNGVSLVEIKDLFGKVGESKLQSLVTNKVVFIENDFAKVFDEHKNFALSSDLTKNFFVNSAEVFYKTNTKYNFVFSRSESVSIKGYCKVMDVLEKAMLDINHVLLENPGDIPFFTGGIMDTMTSDDIFSKKEKK
jgi:hypothetical protein